MNEFHLHENDLMDDNRGLDPVLIKSVLNRGEEASIPDSIAVGRRCTSSWGKEDEYQTADTSLYELITVRKELKQMKLDQKSENDDDRKNGIRSFSLEMMCCLALLIVIGVALRIMWRKNANPSM
jgi:hypothetical protein